MEKPASVQKLPFYALAVLGTFFTWGRMGLDGSLSHLLVALHGPKHYVLPGTHTPLRTRFTGIYWPVDYFLDVLVVFFWEAVDGSHPTTSVIGIYFLGQYLPILVSFYVDSLRNGNAKSFGLFKTSVWIMIFQMTGIGCTGAIWALSYISYSPLFKDSPTLSELRTASLAPSDRVAAVLPSLALGYILPAIAMTLPSPSVISDDTKQIALVLWNIFPILVFLSYTLLSPLIPSSASTRSWGSYIKAVRFAYAVSATVGVFIHIGTAAMSVSTLLFPMLFSPAYLGELHPASLTIPPFSFPQGETVGDSVRSFFLWDQVFGYTIAALIALRQYKAACAAKGIGFSWAKSTLGMVATSMLVGPGVACVGASWLRDEMLFGDGDVEGQKRK